MEEYFSYQHLYNIDFLYLSSIKNSDILFYFTGNSGELIEFAGLENFIELSSDSDFYYSLFVTFKFVFYTTIFSIVVALFLAIICNEKLKGIPIFRTFFSSTMGISVSAASTIVLFMFHPSVGIINTLLKK